LVVVSFCLYKFPKDPAREAQANEHKRILLYKR